MFRKKILHIISLIQTLTAQILHKKDRIEKCSEKMIKETKSLKNGIKNIDKTLAIQPIFILAYHELLSKFIIDISQELWIHRILSLCNLLLASHCDLYGEYNSSSCELLVIAVILDMTINCKDVNPFSKEQMLLYKKEVLNAGATGLVNRDAIHLYFSQLLDDSTRLFEIHEKTKKYFF